MGPPCAVFRRGQQGCSSPACKRAWRMVAFQRTRGENLAMTRYENKVFENQHVILDDGVFVNCTFKNCSLEYSGADVYVQNCQGEGCQLVWLGPAQRTAWLLQGLGLMVPPAAPPGTVPPRGVQWRTRDF